MPSDGVVSLVPWPPTDPNAATAASGNKLHIWANGDFSFQDFLDTINPLQHLPIVSTIYGWITDKHNIGDLPRIAGDALYGGPWGALSGLVNALVKEESGKDIGEHAVALLTGDDKSAPAAVASADAAGSAGSAPPPTVPTDTAATQETTPAAPAAASNSSPSSAAAPSATSPSPAPASSTAAAPAAVLPDHPPIPLYRSPVSTSAGGIPTTQATSRNSDPAARSFLAQNAERQRQLYRGGTLADSDRVLNSQPVALMVPPGALPNGGRPRLQPVAPPAATPIAAPPDPSTPVDISQKMMDALDKYMALQQKSEARGAQLDVAP